MGLSHKISHFPTMFPSGWWYTVYLPLWKNIRQLGLWNSQLNGQIKFMWQTTNQPLLVAFFFGVYHPDTSQHPLVTRRLIFHPHQLASVVPGTTPGDHGTDSSTEDSDHTKRNHEELNTGGHIFYNYICRSKVMLLRYDVNKYQKIRIIEKNTWRIKQQRWTYEVITYGSTTKILW